MSKVHTSVKIRKDGSLVLPAFVMRGMGYAPGEEVPITLRIHDLKTGVVPAHMEQLEIYAALFCLEYKVKPSEIEMELRLYQNNEILYHTPTAEDIVPIMDKIITFDKVIRKIKEQEGYALEWKNDHYYLIGYSHKHKGIAHFRVDRLTSVEPLDSKFQPMPDFDVAAYTNKMVDMFAAEHAEQVKLLCSNELMRVIIDHYGEDIEISPYDDTHFTVIIEVNPSGTFYGWVFKFMGKIRILSPQSCVDKMQDIARTFI